MLSLIQTLLFRKELSLLGLENKSEVVDFLLERRNLLSLAIVNGIQEVECICHIVVLGSKKGAELSDGRHFLQKSLGGTKK